MAFSMTALGIHDFWLFVSAGVLLNITPGPDMALIVARSARQGIPAGVAAAFGIGSGTLVHIAAAAMGISALILASAWTFAVLKWAGAIYLIYIGGVMLISSLKPSGTSTVVAAPAVATFRACFAQGFFTNALNPKVAIFFLALMPQFINQNAPLKATAFVVLGITFILTGTTWNLLVAVGSGKMAVLREWQAFQRWIERVTGTILIGVGIKLALMDR